MNDRSSTKNADSNDSFHGPNVRVGGTQHFIPLKTKLYIPPLRSRWITRSRLFKRMDVGFEGKLTLISAPAGFGKTTLLVDWVHRHKIKEFCQFKKKWLSDTRRKRLRYASDTANPSGA